jgi:hypothetical protein
MRQAIILLLLLLPDALCQKKKACLGALCHKDCNCSAHCNKTVKLHDNRISMSASEDGLITVDWRPMVEPRDKATCFVSVLLEYGPAPEVQARRPREGKAEPFIVSLCGTGGTQEIFIVFSTGRRAYRRRVLMREVPACAPAPRARAEETGPGGLFLPVLATCLALSLCLAGGLLYWWWRRREGEE